MTRRPRQVLAAAATVVGLLALAGCGGAGSDGAGPNGAAYTFHQDQGGIKVDTPALRSLKSSAHIEACPRVSPPAKGVDGGLPGLTLPCLGGGHAVDLAALRGPLLVNFWAQTCGPCKAESPLLQHLSTSAAGRVKVLGIDFIDARPGSALAFAKELGLTYPQLADPDGAAKAPLRIVGLPWTLFVDATGAITYTQTGPITSADQLAALLHDHLGVTVPGLGT